ncbi:MAG TPA: hypothetical protein VFD58_26440 [Blastocatellia bacterium]|nr:hypothetical protein [Blastocatellia bacterium]
MKKLPLLMIGSLLFVMYTANSRGQVEPDNAARQWLEERYKEATSIKPGMTRADLMTVFEMDGGFDRIPASRYVLKSCKMIKVEVEFDTQYGRAYKETPDAKLKITRISRPYLEHQFMD